MATVFCDSVKPGEDIRKKEPHVYAAFSLFKPFFMVFQDSLRDTIPVIFQLPDIVCGYGGRIFPVFYRIFQKRKNDIAVQMQLLFGLF